MADDHKETEEPLLLQDGETSDDGAAGGSGGTVYGSDASEADTLDTAEPEDHTIPGKDVAEDSSRTGTIFSSVVNLVNTVVGAGVLSLPFAFNKTGVVVGSTVLLMCYFLMGFSCWLLLECQEQCGDKSYRDIAKAAMILSTYFTLVSYLIIIGDMFSVVIGEAMGGSNEDMCSVFANRRFSMTLSLMFVGPLSMMQNIDSLKYTSYAAVASILYLTLVVVIQSGRNFGKDFEPEDISFGEFTEAIFRALPIITLAFTCQQTLFPIMGALKSPTRPREHKIIGGALTTCLFLYACVGIFGYLTFFGDVKGNVLLNYDPHDPLIIVGRVSVGLVIIFSFPLMALPLLNTIDDIFFKPEVWSFSYCRRAIIMVITLGSQYVIAMFMTDISVTLGIAGSTGNTALAFILPALFYYKLSERELRDPYQMAALSLVVLGGFFLVVSTTVTLVDAATESQDASIGAACNTSALDGDPANVRTSFGYYYL